MRFMIKKLINGSPNNIIVMNKSKMSDLATAFDCSTGIYSLYRWCKYFGVPKDVYYVILGSFKNLNRKYCSLGIRSRYVGGKGEPIGDVMRTYFKQIPKGVTTPNDYVTAGKIIFTSLVYKETNSIFHHVAYYLDYFIYEIKWVNARHVCTNDVLKISYDLVFYVIGKYFGHFIDQHDFPKSIDCDGCKYFKPTKCEPFPQCDYRGTYTGHHKKCSPKALRSFLRQIYIDCILLRYGCRKSFIMDWPHVADQDPNFYPFFPRVIISDLAEHISGTNRTINL